MNVISHVVYPALLAQSANIYHIRNHKAPIFKAKHLLLIGLCGGLPDILSPHLGLEDRYQSFSHSIWFLLLMLAATWILAWRFPKHAKLMVVCFFATAFHLLCDMMAGGINLYGPFGRQILGSYYISFHYWIPLDISGILLLLVSILYARVPARARPIALVSGLIIAGVGTGIAFTSFDMESVLTKKIPAAKITPARLEQALHPWNSLIKKWDSGVFEELSNEFAVNLREGFTPQAQKEFYAQMKSEYGDFRGLKLVEVKAARFYFPRISVYRFIGAFSKTEMHPEISILFDGQGKVTGLIFREKWKDKIL
jgi:membrane-bound metal-dependent hydrolase YbcI (DUF457 family)